MRNAEKFDIINLLELEKEDKAENPHLIWRKKVFLEEESMNWKSIMILLAAVGSLYSLLLGVVRYFSLGNPTPANLRDVYDADTYEKWKKYSKEHARLGMISSLVSGVITILLILTNAYAAFASLFPFTMEWQIFGVILLETVVDTIVSVVKSYISTMKIEQKYGFNRSTMKTFVFDKIGGFVLSLGVAFAISEGIGAAKDLFGIWMIPAFAVLGFLGSLVISFLYPVFSRIGNKFTPLPEGELRDSLMKLLKKYGYKVKEIQVMDASRRTTKLNAYFTGFGKLKTIVLYDNLVNAMSTEEITAVFAHELGHGLHKDIQKRQVLSIFQLLVMGAVAYYLTSAVDFSDFGFIYVEGGITYSVINYGMAYVLLGIALSVLQPILGFIMNASSRRAEFRADRQAVIEGYGEAMISAFKKMARDNFSHLSPSWINVVLEYSHPPLKARIRGVERAMKRYGKRASTRK